MIITPAAQIQVFPLFLLDFQQIHILLILALDLRHIFINRKYVSRKPHVSAADKIAVDIILDPLRSESQIVNRFLSAFEIRINIFLIFRGPSLFNFNPFDHFFNRKIFLLGY
jgi:hypothetical protein